ncbi:hypothetical protein PG984_007015 [Apiospora sp. TS-2023a]
MSNMKVLISGCGVGGASLDFWLARMGAGVTVTERFPGLRASGQQIDLRGPALVNAEDQTVAYFPPDPQSISRQGFSSEYEIMRGDLVQVLYDTTRGKENVRCWFDKSIESLTHDDVADPAGEVHVSFSDGHQDDFDLVVGAVGVYSQTRKIMMGPKFAESLVPQHTHFAYFSIPAQPDDTNRWTACFLPGRVLLMSRKDHPDFLRAYMMIYGGHPSLEAAYESRDKVALRRAWDGLLRGRGWKADRFCDGLLHSPESQDLVALLGDAAYASTLNGMGTSVAMAAAYVMAGEIATLLSKGETVHRANPPGHGKLREDAPSAHRHRAEGESGWPRRLVSTDGWGIRLLQLAARAAAFLRLDRLGWFTGDNLHEWQLPAYPSLEASSQPLLKTTAEC